VGVYREKVVLALQLVSQLTLTRSYLAKVLLEYSSTSRVPKRSLSDCNRAEFARLSPCSS
jgi:hypothetical protein